MLRVAQLSRGEGQVGQVTIQVGFLVGQLLNGRFLQVASIVLWQRPSGLGHNRIMVLGLLHS